VLSASIILACGVLFMHVLRIWQLNNNVPFKRSHNVYWSTFIVLLSLITLIMEIHYGVLYPYLSREKAVTISDGSEGTGRLL